MRDITINYNYNRSNNHRNDDDDVGRWNHPQPEDDDEESDGQTEEQIRSRVADLVRRFEVINPNTNSNAMMNSRGLPDTNPANIDTDPTSMDPQSTNEEDVNESGDNPLNEGGGEVGGEAVVEARTRAEMAESVLRQIEEDMAWWRDQGLGPEEDNEADGVGGLDVTYIPSEFGDVPVLVSPASAAAAGGGGGVPGGDVYVHDTNAVVPGVVPGVPNAVGGGGGGGGRGVDDTAYLAVDHDHVVPADADDLPAAHDNNDSNNSNLNNIVPAEADADADAAPVPVMTAPRSAHDENNNDINTAPVAPTGAVAVTPPHAAGGTRTAPSAPEDQALALATQGPTPVDPVQTAPPVVPVTPDRIPDTAPPAVHTNTDANADAGANGDAGGDLSLNGVAHSIGVPDAVYIDLEAHHNHSANLNREGLNELEMRMGVVDMFPGSYITGILRRDDEHLFETAPSEGQGSTAQDTTQEEIEDVAPLLELPSPRPSEPQGSLVHGSVDDVVPPTGHHSDEAMMMRRRDSQVNRRRRREQQREQQQQEREQQQEQRGQEREQQQEQRGQERERGQEEEKEEEREEDVAVGGTDHDHRQYSAVVVDDHDRDRDNSNVGWDPRPAVPADDARSGLPVPDDRPVGVLDIQLPSLGNSNSQPNNNSSSNSQPNNNSTEDAARSPSGGGTPSHTTPVRRPPAADGGGGRGGEEAVSSSRSVSSRRSSRRRRRGGLMSKLRRLQKHLGFVPSSGNTASVDPRSHSGENVFSDGGSSFAHEFPSEVPRLPRATDDDPRSVPSSGVEKDSFPLEAPLETGSLLTSRESGGSSSFGGTEDGVPSAASGRRGQQRSLVAMAASFAAAFDFSARRAGLATDPEKRDAAKEKELAAAASARDAAAAGGGGAGSGSETDTTPAAAAAAGSSSSSSGGGTSRSTGRRGRWLFGGRPGAVAVDGPGMDDDDDDADDVETGRPQAVEEPERPADPEVTTSAWAVSQPEMASAAVVPEMTDMPPPRVAEPMVPEGPPPTPSPASPTPTSSLTRSRLEPLVDPERRKKRNMFCLLLLVAVLLLVGWGVTFWFFQDQLLGNTGGGGGGDANVGNSTASSIPSLLLPHP